ncbi:uncharacterized protein LOC132960171, partial [Labrus mixtus]|uniref:uncharacterized protein LOC132960171 n=1 Tax=Labrus mixtus TaxID=508554 RepID=UPI0029BFCB6A
MDCLAELRALEHAGSLSSIKGGRHDSSQDDFLSPCRLKHKDLHRPSISTATPDRRSTQDSTSWHAASSDQQDDLREVEGERKRWSEFRDRKRTKTLTVLQLRKHNPTEPIVLSSEEEDEGEDEGDGGRRLDWETRSRNGKQTGSHTVASLSPLSSSPRNQPLSQSSATPRSTACIPPHRMHWTLHVDPTGRDLEYFHHFSPFIGQACSVFACTILLCKQGGALLTHQLGPVASSLFQQPDSAPHLTLYTCEGYEPKDLGPIAKTLQTLTPTISHLYQGMVYSHYEGVAWTVTVDDSWLADDEDPVCTISPFKNTNMSHPLSLFSVSVPPQSPATAGVPDTLWSQYSNECGLMLSHPPVSIPVKLGPAPRKQQYPLSQASLEGIKPVITTLLKQGILVPCQSPCNTPILPVKKPNSPDWRFVQDLRLINDYVAPMTPVVPSPTTILTSIPPSTQWYSVVDLCSAFFSIPVSPESQYLFAFTYGGHQYTWTRLPQGFIHSPTLFARALLTDLADVQLPGGSALIQYVDDLLVASPTKEACETDTRALLLSLAEKGHKASATKAQLVLQEVTYLGHVLKGNTRQVSSKRVSAVLNIPKPHTKKQLKSFLGILGYSRPWIMDFAPRARPLQDMLLQAAPEHLQWTEDAETAFTDLKQALSQAPALGLPDYSKPFQLYVHERNGFASGVLTQQHGSNKRPVGYYSTRLDNTELGLPPCLRAVAAAAFMVRTVSDLVLDSQCELYVPHAVSALLTRASTQHLSAARQSHYELLLLSMPNLTIHRSPTLDPSSLLPTAADCEPHDCQATVTMTYTIREDLFDTPLFNPDLTLFTDGSSSRNLQGTLDSGWAVVSSTDTLLSGKLPDHFSAQQAELVALTQACTYAKNKSVNIYTDSRYALGVCLDFGGIWRHRDFLTSAGTPIKNASLVEALLKALFLPSTVAILKCDARTSSKDPVRLGNARADTAAKAAAVSGALAPVLATSTLVSPSPDPSVHDLQFSSLHAGLMQAHANGKLM